ncbi:MAG: PTS fructose transporter subunit EIIC [Sporolactobacillus sp.]
MITVLKNMKTHLMTGVSYMIPFVVAGGVLLALSVMFSGKTAVPTHGLLGDISTIGLAGMALYVPILGGFIAYSMVGKPGIGPGMIAAYLAYATKGGFLGGMIAGIVAGIVVYYLKKIKGPKQIGQVLPIFIIPLLGSLISGMIILLVLADPIASFMTILNHWLLSMQGGSKVLLAIILGSMIAFDMGGPFNKTAFFFAVAVMPTYPQLMAVVAVADCTPPLGLAIATFIAKKKFTQEEIEAGKAALIMGCIGITEGAIPFAAADPFRVIPSIMVGSASAGITSILLGATNHAPWGGLIVLPVTGNWIGYFFAAIVGTAVTTLCLVLVKRPIDQLVKKEEKAIREDDLELNF